MLICQEPAHFLSAQMALVSTFFQMFIVIGMYNFDCTLHCSHALEEAILEITFSDRHRIIFFLVFQIREGKKMKKIDNPLKEMRFSLLGMLKEILFCDSVVWKIK